MTAVLYFGIVNMVRVSPLMLGWSYQPHDRQQLLSTLKAPRLPLIGRARPSEVLAIVSGISL